MTMIIFWVAKYIKRVLKSTQFALTRFSYYCYLTYTFIYKVSGYPLTSFTMSVEPLSVCFFMCEIGGIH